MSKVSGFEDFSIETIEQEHRWYKHVELNEKQKTIFRSIIELVKENERDIIFLEKTTSPYVLIETLRKKLQLKAQNEELTTDELIQAYLLITELEESLFS